MCKEFEKNKRLLDQLIDKKRSFSKRELVKEYYANRSKHDPALFDPILTIPVYLDLLCEAHVLRREPGYYIHC